MPLDDASIAGHVAADRPRPERRRRVPAAGGLSVPDQPLVRRAVRLPHEVGARRADARPRERDHRRRPADQQEAGPERGAAAGGPRRGGGGPVHLRRRGAGRLAREPGRRGLRERQAAARRSARSSTSSCTAAATAVEPRDPTTSGHSERVADADRRRSPSSVDGSPRGPSPDLHFTREQVAGAALRGAAPRLRQGGGAGEVPAQGEEALRHAADRRSASGSPTSSRPSRPTYLRARLEALAAGRGATRGPSSPRSRPSIEAHADGDRADAPERARRQRADRRGGATRFSALMNLPARDRSSATRPSRYREESRFPVEDWAEAPYLSADELEALSIRKGSLSDEERGEIESHVTHTYEFLRQDPVDGRAAPHPGDRLGAPREARRLRLPAADSPPPTSRRSRG